MISPQSGILCLWNDYFSFYSFSFVSIGRVFLVLMLWCSELFSSVVPPLQVVFDLILTLTTLTAGNLYDMSTVTIVSCFFSLCWECAMADVNIMNWKCISKNFGYINFKSIFLIMVHWHLSVNMGKILQQIALLKVQSIKIKSEWKIWNKFLIKGD